MVGLATFIAARQGGRIIVDEQGYHFKKTSVNKKTGVSYFLTLCRFTLCRFTLSRAFDPLSFDPVSFDPLSVNPKRMNGLKVNSVLKI